VTFAVIESRLTGYHERMVRSFDPPGAGGLQCVQALPGLASAGVIRCICSQLTWCCIQKA
jgi:hypothetical protein